MPELGSLANYTDPAIIITMRHAVLNRIYVRWLFIIIPSLVPAIIWWVAKPASIELQNSQQILDAVAKITALTALSLLSVNIIISARIRFFDRIFFGLDNMYRTHHLTGAWVLIFVLVHSALLTLKYSLISLPSGYQFLKPSTNIPMLAGEIAVLVLAGLIVLIMYFRVRYEWLIICMRVLGAVIFIGGYHALFVSGSDLRSITPLYAYMLALGGLAASLYLWRSVFRRRLHRPYEYVIDQVIPHSAITEVWLSPTGAALQRFAGQFVYSNFLSKSVSTETHPFTISSGSNDRRIRFCIKNIGDYTATVSNLTPGEAVKLEGPYGRFSFTKAHQLHQVWVAGGIGITPFLAMARSLDQSLHYHINLYYIIRTEAEAVFLSELENISKQHPHFKVLPIFTQLQGRPKATDLMAGTRLKYTDVLLCGPPLMMKRFRMQLMSAGVPRRHIYTEEFEL